MCNSGRELAVQRCGLLTWLQGTCAGYECVGIVMPGRKAGGDREAGAVWLAARGWSRRRSAVRQCRGVERRSGSKERSGLTEN